MTDLLWCLRHDGIAQVAAAIAVGCALRRARVDGPCGQEKLKWH
jgi:hypothetical protein